MMFEWESKLSERATEFLAAVRADAENLAVNTELGPEASFVQLHLTITDKNYLKAGQYFALAMKDITMGEPTSARNRYRNDAALCSEWVRSKINIPEQEEFVLGARIQ